MKGRKGAASKHQEVKMKLVTRFELASKSKGELHALLCNIFNTLACSRLSAPERRNALASLENILSELGVRPPSP